MREDELRAAFDRQAAGYDEQWDKMAPIRGGLYLLVESMFAELPADARILCVGVGTGADWISVRLPSKRPSNSLRSSRERASVSAFSNRHARRSSTRFSEPRVYRMWRASPGHGSGANPPSSRAQSDLGPAP